MTGPMRQYIRTHINLYVRSRPQIVDFCDECGASFEIPNRTASARSKCASCKPNAQRRLHPALGT